MVEESIEILMIFHDPLLGVHVVELVEELHDIARAQSLVDIGLWLRAGIVHSCALQQGHGGAHERLQCRGAGLGEANVEDQFFGVGHGCSRRAPERILDA
ncbi:hypothetical protein D3C81_1525280 [compost metagenome]